MEENKNFNNNLNAIKTSAHSYEDKYLFEKYAPSELTDSYRILSTPSSFAKTTLFYIQEIGKLKSLKPHTSKRESLDSFLFIIVTTGSGIFTYKNKKYLLKAGDHVFINCKNSYSHESNDSDPWELMWVHFNGILADSYYTYFSNKMVSIVFQPEEPFKFITIVEDIMRLANNKNTNSELIVSNLLNTLITQTLLHASRSIDKTDVANDKTQQWKEFIDRNFKNKISLDLLADKFFISKYHMSREFKKAYGITIANYIIAKRITYAKELLRFTNMHIVEVSKDCGIEDKSYFTKVFRKYEGMTATDYRKKWKGLG